MNRKLGVNLVKVGVPPDRPKLIVTISFADKKWRAPHECPTCGDRIEEVVCGMGDLGLRSPHVGRQCEVTVRVKQKRCRC